MSESVQRQTRGGFAGLRRLDLNPNLINAPSTPHQAVQKGRVKRTLIINSVMPDSDPASPAFVRDRRFRWRVQKMSASSAGWRSFWTDSMH